MNSFIYFSTMILPWINFAVIASFIIILYTRKPKHIDNQSHTTDKNNESVY